MLSRAGVVAAMLAGALLLPACGGSSHETASNPPPQPLSARDPRASNVPPAVPGDFRRPIAAYRAHVRAQLGRMLEDVGALRAAVARGDLAGARGAWLRADERYESIGAAYGAFGDLDAAINGRPGGLPGGVRSPEFSGLHRVELALWDRRSTRAAASATARLAVDVRRLRARVARMEIDPLEYSLRSHEVLEDTLHIQLTGEASRWSGAALYALRANLAGTRVVLRSLQAMIERRSPQAYAQAWRAVASVQRALGGLTGTGGRLPRWDALGQRDRERIDGLTAAAAEQLAYVPELIDPRPLRPVQRVFGSGA